MRRRFSSKEQHRGLARACWGIWLVGALLETAGCAGNGTDSADQCEANDVRSCSGEGSCEGEQVCAGTPLTWTRCNCLPEPPDSGSAPLPSLGAACEADQDCPSGAFCLAPDGHDYFGGGPPSGICVAPCSSSSGSCDGFDGATCVPLEGSDGGPDGGASPTALCFAACSVGSSAGSKCGGIETVACAPLAEGKPEGFCRPVCTTDQDCSADRLCDPRTGACVDSSERMPGADLGAPCDPMGAASQCDGICAELSSDSALCSHRCVFGREGDCAPLDDALATGGCLFVTPDGTLGDLGFCAELCDCSDDCVTADAVCDPLDDPDLEAAFGRPGVCTPPDLALGEPIACN